jgi:teichuronic acid exporter
LENLKQKTFKAFAWDMAGKLADQGIGFFISIILARLLAPEEFGLLAMASVIISLAQVLIDSGLGTALIQRQDVRDDHYSSVFCFNMLVGSALTLIFFSTAGIVAGFYNRIELKPIIQVLSFSFFINSFARVQTAWLTKKLNFGILTRARIISLIISGSIGITMAFLHYGVWALVIQSLLGGILTNVYISVYAKWKPKLMFRWQALKELWKFGFRIFISGLINTITHQVDNLIIGKLFSAQTLGFYQRSKSLNDFVVKYSSGSLVPVLMPALSSVQNDKERYNRIVLNSYHLISIVTFFIVGFLYLISEEMISVLFTAKWLPSVVYFKIMLLSGFVYPLSALLVNVLTSSGNSKGFLRLTLLKETLVVINLLVGFHFGLLHFLYGYTIYSVIALILNFHFASKEMKTNTWLFSRVTLEYLLITLLSVGLMMFIFRIFLVLNPYFKIFEGLIGFSLIYLILNILAKSQGLLILRDEMLKIIKQK